MPFATGMGFFDEREWNSLLVSSTTLCTRGHPALAHGFLALLERSGAASPAHGWVPKHYFRREGGRLVACAPLYERSSSAGDFVWDFAWVELSERLGRPYYPRLVGMIPATPSPGYGLLVAEGADPERELERFLDEAFALRDSSGYASLNFHFASEAFSEAVSRDGRFSPWLHHSFLWDSNGLESFDDYLARFGKNRRRNVRRERASLKARGIETRMVLGSEAPSSWYPLMWRYYLATNEKFGPWAALYMTEEFFLRLKEAYPEGHAFAASFAPGREEPIALALFLVSRELIAGRYWGAAEFVPGLHFEACYYAPIEWAIARGIKRFDPGAGSPHKAWRGFKAEIHASWHAFADPLMRRVFSANIGRLNDTARAEAELLNSGDFALG